MTVYLEVVEPGMRHPAKAPLFAALEVADMCEPDHLQPGCPHVGQEVMLGWAVWMPAVLQCVTCVTEDLQKSTVYPCAECGLEVDEGAVVLAVSQNPPITACGAYCDACLDQMEVNDYQTVDSRSIQRSEIFAQVQKIPSLALLDFNRHHKMGPRASATKTDGS